MSPIRWIRPWLPAAGLAFLLMQAKVLRAHDPGFGTAELRFGRARVSAEVGLAPVDLRSLDPALPDKLSWTAEDLAAARPVLLRLAPGLMEVRGAGGNVAWHDPAVALKDGSLLFSLTGALPGSGTLAVAIPALGRMPAGCRFYVSAVDSKGKVLAEKILSANDNSVTMDLEPQARPEARSAP